MPALTTGEPIGALDSTYLDQAQQSPIYDASDPFATAIDQRQQAVIDAESRLSEMDKLKDSKLWRLGAVMSAFGSAYTGRPSVMDNYNAQQDALHSQINQSRAGIEDLNLKKVMMGHKYGPNTADTVGSPLPLANGNYGIMVRNPDGSTEIRDTQVPFDPKVTQMGGQFYNTTGGQPRALLTQEQVVTNREREAADKRAGAAAAEQGKAEYQVPVGYRRTDDGSMEPVPGSPADQKIREAAQKRAEGMNLTEGVARTVVDDTQRALDVLGKSGGWAAGAGSYLSVLPYTPARTLQKHIDSIKGNIGVDSLLRIKKSGAGLGAIPQAQLEMLASLMGNLDTAQSPAELKYNLVRIEEIYADIVQKNGGDPREIPAERQARQTGTSKPTVDTLGPPSTNAQGWPLMEDANGNRAYVGPNGEIEELN